RDGFTLARASGSRASGSRTARSLRRFLAVALTLWMVVKVVYVEVIVPQRVAKRHTYDKAAALAGYVPLGHVLYLFRIKDEGILFYYGRPAIRLHCIDEIPHVDHTVYCLLTAEEWRTWRGPQAELAANMQDAQGDAIVLVRVLAASAFASQ